MNLSEIPSSVYRLQLGREFTLLDAASLIPYLSELGVEGIYCSPLFEHAGDNPYEITNPNCPSLELGGIEAFNFLSTALKEHGLLHVLDIVPNHMGFRAGGNSWWQDVMAKGEDSPYAPFFDIDWDPENTLLKHKVLLPILKNSYGKALENQEITLTYYDGQYWIAYADYLLPLSPETTGELENLPPKTVLEDYKGTSGDPSSFNKLDALLDRQFYRLSHWLVGGQEINYRRFFNVNELVAIHIEDEKVFSAHHAWVFDLIATGDVQGLRIDHPDGLYDPAQYFERLKSKQPGFILVEKILDFREKLPEDWTVDGTVGYDYLALLNGLFIQKKNEKAFSRIYEKFIGHEVCFKTLLYERRKSYIDQHMGSVAQTLGNCLHKISQKKRNTRDFTRADLIHAIQETIACFPVYRTYIRPEGKGRSSDADYVSQAIETAKNKTPEIDTSVYDYLKSTLLDIKGEEDLDAVDFLLRFQQITAPVMAKGLEDSTFYLYNRLISANEVGSNPQHFGHSKTEFFEYNKEQLERGRTSLLPSSTHDTKYSEDVRMRLNVISEIPEKWQECVLLWKKTNKKHKVLVQGRLAPDHNTEYYLYQMLLGAWPEKPDAKFQTRLKDAFLKILREAGVFTSWRRPNQEYENAALHFLEEILKEHPENLFLSSFLSLQKEIALYGFQNSLSALVLKIGSVGIADIYQGCESFAQYLVDPDNRRPVDFSQLASDLYSLEKEPPLDSRVKQFVTAKALKFRKERKELFLRGEFLSLDCSSETLITFMRCHKDQQAIILGSRFFAERAGKSWGEESIQLPKDFPSGPLKELFTGADVNVQMKEKRPTLFVADALKTLPCAILYR